jgi:hypothetical protein
MSIHNTTVSPELRNALSSLDCWNIGTADVAQLAALTFGNPHMPLLRHGTMSAIIARTKYGGAAKRFDDEFRLLGQQCATIRAGPPRAELCAVAFFHLRFGGIHPLVDGNGRVGRLLLCEQIRQAFAVPLETTLDSLQASHLDYRAVFITSLPQEQFELMIQLLARVVDDKVASTHVLPFPVAPAYPDKRAALNSMKPDKIAPRVDVHQHSFQPRAVTAEFQRSLIGTPKKKSL